MKISTLFNYFPTDVVVSINGGPLYSTEAEVLKPFLEYDVKSIYPGFRGYTAYMGIETREPIDPERMKIRLL